MIVYKVYKTIQRLFYSLSIIFALIILPIFATSCGLFDKDLKQDQHLAEYRRQMSRIVDSLDNHKARIAAFENVIKQIKADDALITPRKKNNLLIEGNTFIGNEYLTLGRYEKALDYTNLVIDIDSTSPKGFYSRGCIYQIMDKDSLAILDYSKTIRLDSEYADAYYNRGIIYEELGQYDNALKDYNKAIKLNPPYIADVYNNRGNAYLASENYDKALSDYSKVIDLDTANVNAYCNRASVYVLQKELPKALADCEKAIALDSTNIESYSRRASVYELMDNYPEAIEDYEKVLVLDPHNNREYHNEIRKTIKKLKVELKKK